MNTLNAINTESKIQSKNKYTYAHHIYTHTYKCHISHHTSWQNDLPLSYVTNTHCLFFCMSESQTAMHTHYWIAHTQWC